MGKIDNNQLGFSAIESLIVLIVVLVLGFVGWYVWHNNKSASTKASTTPQLAQNNSKAPSAATTSPAALTFKTIETVSWKQVNKTFSFLQGSLIYKYPSDWTLEEVTQSGHPNYATITSYDKTQCVKFTVSRNEATVAEEIKNLLNSWDASGPEPNVLATTTSKVNGGIATIDEIKKENKKFYVAVAKLGKDVQYPTNIVYADLSSCGTSEGDIFNALVNSISVESRVD